MQLPTLYAYDSKGKVKVWDIKVDDLNGYFTITHGQLGGKQQVKDTACKPKNKGKANETSAYTQACKEVKARWVKQTDKGYAEKLGEGVEVLNPMLACDFRNRSSSIVYPAYVQPKLDGVRCVCKLVDGVITFTSRGGKAYKVPKHILVDLEVFFDKHKDIVLDGEVYIHGTPLQDIVSAVRNSPKKLPKDKNSVKYQSILEDNEKIENNHAKLTYCVFDIAYDAPWSIRRETLFWCKDKYTTVNLEFIADIEINSEAEVYEYHDGYVSQGYEGVMIRNANGLYRWNYRSSELQKYKVFKDEEFLIVDIVEANEGFGVPVCKLNDTSKVSPEYIKKFGYTFKATFKGSHKQRLALFMERDNIIGKSGTVKFQTYTNDGIPQFPVMLNLREVDANGIPME